jgi:mRNA interferase MazF
MISMAKAQVPQRGEIWLLHFDPAVGAEIRKLRPAVVVNLDSIGKLPLRIVVPLTDWQAAFAALPWFVPIAANSANGLAKDSGADAFQVKSLSVARFDRKLGAVSAAQMDAISGSIAMCVGAP